LGGGQGLQTIEGMMEVVCPNNCILYAKEAGYSSSLANFHLIESGVSLSKMTLCVISPCKIAQCAPPKVHLGCSNSPPKISFPMFFNVHTLLLAILKISGVISFGVSPLSHGDVQNRAFSPFPMVTKVAATNNSWSFGIQGFPSPTSGFL
jgi:hypothetical protein